MGKKRRYIQRANKFAKKAFNFLDKIDGTQDSQLLSAKLDTIISEINLADRGNGTFSIQVEGMGPGSAGSAGLEADKVVYTIDGVAVNANGKLTFAANTGTAKNDRDNLKTDISSPARSGTGAADVIITAGPREIEAIIQNEAGNVDVSKAVSKVLTIVEPVKDLAAVTAAEDANPGDIQVDIAAGIDLAAAASAGAAAEAAGRLPGEENFDLGNVASSKNSLIVSLVDKDGAAVAIKAVDGCTTVGDNVQSTAAAGGVFHFQAAANGGEALPGSGSPYVMTVTPADQSGTAHTPSAITISVPIA